MTLEQRSPGELAPADQDAADEIRASIDDARQTTSARLEDLLARLRTI